MPTGRAFPDQMVQFLLTQVAAKETVHRSGALRVLRHYITRLGISLTAPPPSHLLSTISVSFLYLGCIDSVTHRN